MEANLVKFGLQDIAGLVEGLQLSVAAGGTEAEGTRKLSTKSAGGGVAEMKAKGRGP